MYIQKMTCTSFVNRYKLRILITFSIVITIGIILTIYFTIHNNNNNNNINNNINNNTNHNTSNNNNNNNNSPNTKFKSNITDTVSTNLKGLCGLDIDNKVWWPDDNGMMKMYTIPWELRGIKGVLSCRGKYMLGSSYKTYAPYSADFVFILFNFSDLTCTLHDMLYIDGHEDMEKLTHVSMTWDEKYIIGINVRSELCIIETLDFIRHGNGFSRPDPKITFKQGIKCFSVFSKEFYVWIDINSEVNVFKDGEIKIYNVNASFKTIALFFDFVDIASKQKIWGLTIYGQIYVLVSGTWTFIFFHQKARCVSLRIGAENVFAFDNNGNLYYTNSMNPQGWKEVTDKVEIVKF